MWYYRGVPHDLDRNSLPRTLALDFSRVVSLDLIPQCTAYEACIQILVLITAVQDIVIGVSSVPPNLDGKQVVLLHMLW
jgi:hypothetical protein